jgi:hypothetical protein
MGQSDLGDRPPFIVSQSPMLEACWQFAALCRVMGDGPSIFARQIPVTKIRSRPQFALQNSKVDPLKLVQSTHDNFSFNFFSLYRPLTPVKKIIYFFDKKFIFI